MSNTTCVSAIVDSKVTWATATPLTFKLTLTLLREAHCWFQVLSSHAVTVKHDALKEDSNICMPARLGASICLCVDAADSIGTVHPDTQVFRTSVYCMAVANMGALLTPPIAAVQSMQLFCSSSRS